MNKTHLPIVFSIVLIVLVSITLSFSAPYEKTPIIDAQRPSSSSEVTNKAILTSADIEKLTAKKIASGEKDPRVYTELLRQYALAKEKEKPSNPAENKTSNSKHFSLAHPDKYTLTKTSAKYVVLDLAGNDKEPEYSKSKVDNPKLDRTIRGRVLKNDEPVAGAPVLVGDVFRNMFNYLDANYGAVSDTDGYFSVLVESDVGYAIIAMHPKLGWSRPIAIQSGRDQVDLTLVIPNSGTIEGTVTRNGQPDCAEISLEDKFLDIMQASDGTGAFRFDNLPPGEYVVRYALCTLPSGDIATEQHKSVTLQEGQTVRLDLELPSGGLISARATSIDGWLPHFLEYYLINGTIDAGTLDELVRILGSTPTGNKRGMLFGGQGDHAPIQFHDVTPGQYTLCAIGMSRDKTQRRYKCQVVSVYEYSNVIEVVITLEGATR